MPRQTINLDAHRAEIESWLISGLTADEVRRNLWKEHGIQISNKTFSRRLREWNIFIKQPYLQNMDALKKRVREIFEEGQMTDAQAVSQLKREGFEVRAKTYQKMRLEMGLYKRSLVGFRPMGTGEVNGVVEQGGLGDSRQAG